MNTVTNNIATPIWTPYDIISGNSLSSLIDFNGDFTYHSSYDNLIARTFERLPTILQIKKAEFDNNKLKIKYKVIADKYLPNEGTLFLRALNAYCIFNKDDDEYWYNSIHLTYNNSDINIKNIKNLTNSFCILINDFNLKLDNVEIEWLADPKAYKDYAHKVLEHLYDEDEKSVLTSKITRLKVHTILENSLKCLND